MLPANHVRVLCMRLCVSGGSHTQYTYSVFGFAFVELILDIIDFDGIDLVIIDFEVK